MEYKIVEIIEDVRQKQGELKESLKQTVTKFELPSSFERGKNFIELNILTKGNNIILSDNRYVNYRVINSTISQETGKPSSININPKEDLQEYVLEENNLLLEYNFLKDIISGDFRKENLSISSISPSRTEIRVTGFNPGNFNIEERVTSFIDEIQGRNYITDYFLYFEQGEYYRAVNIKLEREQENLFIDIKLNTTLPNSFNQGDLVSIVEQISETRVFEVIPILIQEQEIPLRLGAPNYCIEVDQEESEGTELLNYEDLITLPISNNVNEITNLLEQKSIRLNIDYSNYENFIFFSSIEERLLNFKYKVELIENLNEDLEVLVNVSNESKSADILTKKVENIVKNFDHYERFLYFEKGEFSWPKLNDSKPYELSLSNSTQAQDWFNERLEEARIYNNLNENQLINTIPEYIQESRDNESYITFIHMIGHHFDNLWIYTDKVLDKYDLDNRLDRGASKDLLEQILKGAGLTIYSSPKSITDLFKYFIDGSLQDPALQINNEVKEGEEVSLEQYEKQIYKRIYHNLPLLIKSKGTERGLKVLINCFGIPTSILSINTFDQQIPNGIDLGEDTGTLDLLQIEIEERQEVEGDTLSDKTSIQKKRLLKASRKKRIDVGFNTNSYTVDKIKDQLNQNFNIDDLIGDPSQDSRKKYSKLEKKVNKVLHNVDKLELAEFIHLIKFFDNRLFKLIKDFVPAKASINKGLIVNSSQFKRSIAETPEISFTQELIEADLEIGDISGDSAGSFQDAKQEYVTDYVNNIIVPEGTPIAPAVGLITKDKTGEQARFDGELKGTELKITDGELNRDNEFKKLRYDEVKYNLRFLSIVPQNLCSIRPSAIPLLISEANLGSLSNINLTNFIQNYSAPTHIIEVGETLQPTETFSGNYNTINTPESFNIEQQYPLIDLEQDNYKFIPLRVLRPDTITPPIDFPLSQDGCLIDQFVKTVFCRLGEDDNKPESINSFQEVDLTDNFFTGLDVNTQVQYFEEFEGTLELIETPGQYIVLNEDRPDGSILKIRVQDNQDSNCFKDIELEYSLCPVSLSVHTDDLIDPIINLDEDLKYERKAAPANPWGDSTPEEIRAIYIPKYFNVPENIDPAKQTVVENRPQFSYVRYYVKVFRERVDNGNVTVPETLLGKIYSNYSGTNEEEGNTVSLFPVLSNRRAYDTVNVINPTAPGFEIPPVPPIQREGEDLEFHTQFMVPLTYWDLISFQGVTSDGNRQSYLYTPAPVTIYEDVSQDNSAYNNEPLAIETNFIFPSEAFLSETLGDKIYIQLGVEYGGPDSECKEETGKIEIPIAAPEDTIGSGGIEGGEDIEPQYNATRSGALGDSSSNEAICSSGTAEIDTFITGTGIQVGQSLLEESGEAPIIGSPSKFLIIRESNKSVITVNTSGEITAVQSCSDFIDDGNTGGTGGLESGGDEFSNTP